MTAAPAPEIAELLQQIRTAADEPRKSDRLVDELAAALDLPRTASERPAGMADVLARLWSMNRATRRGRPCPTLYSRALTWLELMLTPSPDEVARMLANNQTVVKALR